MPEHIPPGRVILREPETFLPAESAPDALCVGTQLVDDDRGIGVAPVQDCTVFLDEHQQLVKSQRRDVDAWRRKVRIPDAAEMRVRKPTVTGDRVNAAEPSLGAQSQDGIDRRKPGSEEDDTSHRGVADGLPMTATDCRPRPDDPRGHRHRAVVLGAHCRSPAPRDRPPPSNRPPGARGNPPSCGSTSTA